MAAVLDRIRSGIAELPPAYFALVMATGIVSIASHLLGYGFIAKPLVWLNILFYGSLWGLTAGRMLWYRERFLADLGDHGRGPGFFTMVAATCVLGSQAQTVMNAPAAARFLLLLGVILWFVLIYTVFVRLAVRESKPTLEQGINGTWLVATVATQSVAVLCALVAIQGFEPRQVLLFFSLCMFLVGCMLYLMIIVLIFYRFMFFALTPEGVGHSYWINMGAVAITTLAGASLIASSPHFDLLQGILPFIIGLTLLFWATATWWIPLLVLLGIWRFVIHREWFAYDPQYWGMVFPLGMYTTCTLRVAQVIHLDFLLVIPGYFIFVALLAWALTFFGLAKSMMRSFGWISPTS